MPNSVTYSCPSFARAGFAIQLLRFIPWASKSFLLLDDWVSDTSRQYFPPFVHMCRARASSLERVSWYYLWHQSVPTWYVDPCSLSSSGEAPIDRLVGEHRLKCAMGSQERTFLHLDASRQGMYLARILSGASRRTVSIAYGVLT